MHALLTTLSLLLVAQDFSPRIELDSADTLAGVKFTSNGEQVVYRRRTGANANHLRIAHADGHEPSRALHGFGPNRETHRDFRVTETHAVFVADMFVDEQLELYSAELDGIGLAVKLSGALPSGGSVDPSFDVDAAGVFAIYIADQDTNDVFELYSVPVLGGAPPTRLNAPLVAGGNVYSAEIHIDSAWVVYLADQDIDGVDEVFAVPITGGAVVQLSNPLVAGGTVESFALAHAVGRVIYLADQDIDQVMELYSAPIPGVGTGPLRKISPVLMAGGVQDYRVAPDGLRVAYLESRGVTRTFHTAWSTGFGWGQASENVRGSVGIFDFSADSGHIFWTEDFGFDLILYAGPSAPATLPSQSFGVGGVSYPTGLRYSFTPDGSRILYCGKGLLPPYPVQSRHLGTGPNFTLSSANESAFDVQAGPNSEFAFYATKFPTEALYRVSITASSPPELLSSAIDDASSVPSITIAPDGRTVVYRADPTNNGDDGLYASAVLGFDAVTPRSGSNLGGQAVMLEGHGFTPTTVVRFDGIDSPSVTQLDGGTLVALAPTPSWPPNRRKHALVEKVVDVEVADGNARVILPRAFTYYRP